MLKILIKRIGAKEQAWIVGRDYSFARMYARTDRGIAET